MIKEGIWENQERRKNKGKSTYMVQIESPFFSILVF
jgi:hypothetical protein